MTKLIWVLFRAVPIAIGTTLISMLPAYASQDANAPQLTRESSPVVLVNPPELHPSTSANSVSLSKSQKVLQTVSTDVADSAQALMGTVALDPVAEPTAIATAMPASTELNQTETRDGVNHAVTPIELSQTPPVIDETEIDQVDINQTDLNGTEVEQVDINQTDIEETEVDGTEVEQVDINQTDIEETEVDGTEVEQVETDDTEIDVVEDELNSSDAVRWRFTFEPYVYLPTHLSGEIGIGDFTTDLGEDSSLSNLGDTLEFDVDRSVSEVVDTLRDTLVFGFMGRAEAWRGHLGIILDASYVHLRQENTTELNLREPFQTILPSRIDVTTNLTYGQFDLGAGYRFASGNVNTAPTVFDAGPIVVDVMGGMRLYTMSESIEIETNRGGEVDRDRSTTFVTPLLSGRFRWNMSPNVAFNVRGDLAGFGVSGLDLAWSITSGFDWMFSGNTSLLLGYRFSYMDFSREIRDRDVDVHLSFNGPYVGMVFRF